MTIIRPRRITEYLEVIWRRRMLFVLMTTAMLIATLYLARRVPNLFESHSLVVVTASTNDERLVQAIPFNLLTQSLTSRANLELLLKRYNLYPEIKDHDIAIRKFEKAIMIETKMKSFPEVPDSISITYRHNDPASAQRVVADLIKPFEDANARSNQLATAEENLIDERIKEVDEKLRQMGPQRSIATIQDQLARTRGDAERNKSQRLAIEATIETLTEKQYALERQISDVQKNIAEQETIVKSAAAANVRTSNPAYGALLVKKLELESQIKEYSPHYTDKHPKMVSLRNQVTDIDHQIERIETDRSSKTAPPILSPEYQELRTMQRDLSRLNTELEIVRHELNLKMKALEGLPGIGPSTIGESETQTGTSSEKEFERLSTLKTYLLDKKDTILKQTTGRRPEVPMFRVVDTPNVPEAPAAPNRLLIQLIAAGMSLCFGLIVVFAFELPRFFLINDERDIEYFLGAPVLALIPESRTPIERARHRNLRLTRGLAIVLVAAALVPTMILLLNRLQIFQILGSR
jgi:protein tyrosine kinase modulator